MALTALSRRARAWLNAWAYSRAGLRQIPSLDLYREFARYRPASSVTLYRGVTDTPRAESEKALKSYTYERGLAEAITSEGGRVETRRVYPSEVLVDFTRLPAAEQFVNEVIVMSPPLTREYRRLTKTRAAGRTVPRLSRS